MFNIPLAQYKDHDLVFLLDEDDSFWFVIRHPQSANHVDSVSFGNGKDFLRGFQSANDAIDVIVEKSSKKVSSFFGESVTEIVDWRSELEFSIRNNMTFKTQPARFERK